jgi:hypothetical protein
LGDYLTKRDTKAPEEIMVKEGADKVLLWLGRDGVGLKKICLLLRRGASGDLERGELEIAPAQAQKMTFIPIYD